MFGPPYRRFILNEVNPLLAVQKQKERTDAEAAREAKRVISLPEVRKALSDPKVEREIIRLLRRTDADKRRAVERALRDPELRKRGDRAVADKANVSKSLVQKVRREMFPDEQAKERVAVRNGTTYTINVSNFRRKKGRGGRQPFDRAKFLADLNRVIDELRKRGEPAHTINRKAVVEEQPFSDENITADALTKRLREAGVKEDFTRYVELRLQGQALKNVR